MTDVAAVPTGPNPLEESGPRIKELGAQLKAAVDVMQESKDTDTARWQKAKDETDTLAKTIEDVKAKQDSDERAKATTEAVEGYQALMGALRSPSKAKAIGGNVANLAGAMGVTREEYVKGSFIGGLMDANSMDHEAQVRGKAALGALGVKWADVPAESKATLGDTDADGGFIVPNNLVDEMLRFGEYMNPYSGLVNRVTGVVGSGVDIPFAGAAPTAAAIAPWGDTKANQDQTYGGVTATLYTYAKIYDIGKQFARNSRGAAEQDVLQSLAESFALAEANATMSGAGTTEPLGVAPALLADGTHTVAHTAAATLVGSTYAAIAAAAGHVSGGNFNGPLTAFLASSAYWRMLAEGTDESGFFYAPSAGPSAIPGVPAGTLVTAFGVAVKPDNQLAAGAAEPMVVGQWNRLKVYEGQAYRVDTSDVAGERWDKNLVGYRGEMELALDAEPAVTVGAFAYVADVNPAS